MHFALFSGPALLLISSEALEIARKLREQYRQNVAIHRTYATMLEKCRNSKFSTFCELKFIRCMI